MPALMQALMVLSWRPPFRSWGTRSVLVKTGELLKLLRPSQHGHIVTAAFLPCDSAIL